MSANGTPPSPEELLRVAGELSRALKLHPLVARTLAGRGHHDVESVRSFLSPRLADLTRPDAMADREAAVARLADAVTRRERVVVFGDYDVDGITATALLTRALRAMGGDVVPMVASRFDGGYGFSDNGLARVMAAGPAVLVTCDCGTSDHPRLAVAREAGVHTIVVDHHKVPDEALPAMAFLNPHRPECAFPYKGLASVGLAFSLAAGVRTRLGATLDMRAFLDLVALGTIADVAPLDGDNRILTRAGLARIADGHGCAGVQALMRHANVKFRLVARDVSFSLAPMLNAPGRLGAPTPTLETLLTEDAKVAWQRAEELAEANQRRKDISNQMIDAAMAQVRAIYGDAPTTGVVVADDGWHPGMGGIVAGRLTDRLGVPVVVIALDGETGVGSVRAPPGTKLYDAVSRCKGDLVVFGGHDAAAGLTVRRERVESFRAGFAEALRDLGPAKASGPKVDVDLVEGDLTEGVARGLLSLEPTGMGNPEPMVRLQSVKFVDARSVANDTHLRVTLAMGRKLIGAFVRDGVALRARGELPTTGAWVEVIGKLRPDPWSGPEGIQVDVVTMSRVS